MADQQRTVQPPSAEELLHAADPDSALPGEDPATPHLDDAVHWITVYGELVNLKEAVIGTADEVMARATDDARQEADIDQRLMSAQADRYRRRREFWLARARELAEPDATAEVG